MNRHSNRALIVLASYDFESLQITLTSLNHTLDKDEIIVVILNGGDKYSAHYTERVARKWASEDTVHRFVVRPLAAGGKALFSIQEILENYQPLNKVDYICKIDDDIIPLRKGWMNALAETYRLSSEKNDVGFITGLINNNCWGFSKILDLYIKKTEYQQMFNYNTRSNLHGQTIVQPSTIDTGFCGTLWQYPYLGWWVHQLTTLNLEIFLERTAGLGEQEIEEGIVYSIGCIYFKKSLWLNLNSSSSETDLDELLIHYSCRNQNLKNIVLMNQPMIHLFYGNQRVCNHDLIDPICKEFSNYFEDETFTKIQKLSSEDQRFILQESVNYIQNDVLSKVNLIFDNLQ